MKELFEKLIAAGKGDALDSLDSMKKAAAELGYTAEQVEEAFADIGGFPVDDNDLAKVAGGYFRPAHNTRMRK